MKIRLYAFGDKLVGKLLDVPENTTPTFNLVLTNPITCISGYSGEKLMERPSFDTLCRFEYTGKIEGDTHARIYHLVNIEKL